MAWEDDIVGPDVASAGLQISERIGREIAAQLDLEEALEASRYTSHPYSSYPKEWPPLAEIVETRELPPVLIERYNASGGEGTALCGIFPEIHRAWASVDNSLFLWRFDKWDGQCSEYSAEEQVICTVGLARVKSGIFVEAIQYILVLATPVEFTLIGVCCTPSGDGLDPFAEITLQPLPEYTVPTDGVTTTCIACTDNGRIFLAGRDGHIYEMQYASRSSWSSRCRKVCLTTGLRDLISRWVVPNAFKFGAVDPIIDMVIDNERGIIYARTEGMRLHVYDLGENGDGPFKKIAEEKNLVDPREAQFGGRRTGSRTTARGSKPSIVCIAPLSATESKRLHLVVVLSDGRRIYLSTYSSGSNTSVGGLSGLSNVRNRPTCLKVIATRPSPPIAVSGGLNFGVMSAAGRTQPEDLALNVETAFNSAGTLVLSDMSASAISSLIIVNRDPTTQASFSGNFGLTTRSIRALRELVSSLPIDGRLLSVADVFPSPDTTAIALSLFSDTEAFTGLSKLSGKTSGKLWAIGDLPSLHILPRRKIVAFSTMGLLEVALNRPVDILKRLFEANASRSQIEEFFNRFGSGEAAAMCLMLAAKLVYDEGVLISSVVSEKAIEAFEDPGLVGVPQLEGNPAMPSTTAPTGSFSMGQVVQDAEPVFSGAYEGLCLCSSRLLFPIWELPVMIMQGEQGFSSGVGSQGEVIVCRISIGAMKILENKIRSLEQFLRSRRNKRRGLYGFVAGLGDYSGTILYGTGSHGIMRNTFGVQSRSTNTGDGMSHSKRQRLSYNSAEIAAMEVRAMECLRRLLRRSSEALFLLQLVCHHNLTRLVQGLDTSVRQKLVQLSFNQFVCSEEGDQIAIRLIASLMEHYIGPNGRGTIHDISEKLKEGCPSYYSEADYKYFQAVEYLEKASMTQDAHERELLAREALNLLAKIPESADLGAICKRFEDLRFYEAVVWLPLQKAQALEAKGDTVNAITDPGRRDDMLALREQCYEIVMNALRSLASVGQKGSSSRPAIRPTLDKLSWDNYIRQIVQLSVQWPDAAFHEYLYKTMIDLGLENELLEYGGSDLVSFLQTAGRKPVQEVPAGTSSVQPTASPINESGSSIVSSQIKYLDLLARYYVLKRQHLLAAHVLYRLAERQCTAAEEAPALEQRLQYLSNAILQAKSASSSSGSAFSGRNSIDDGLLDMLEAKLSVLRFQMQIKDELELIASRSESTSGSRESLQDDPSPSNLVTETDIARRAREKATELSLNLKSITQLYNDYAVPFKLWEICLEMLNFANYSGDADSKIVRETWARLLDQALSRGGVVEACSAVKRVGSKLYPGDGACLPLSTLCLHLEKAALERLTSGVELIGEEEISRSLLAACKGAPEPVLSAYDQLLSNGTILASPYLKLRLLQSVLVVLHEWAMSVLAQKLGTTTAGASFIFGGSFPFEQTTTMASQEIRDKILSFANRYMTEVRRLALPQLQTEPVYKGFKALEEKLTSSSSFRQL